MAFRVFALRGVRAGPSLTIRLQIPEGIVPREFLRTAFLYLAAAVLLVTGAAQAQIRTTGSIAGLIVDPSGAAVPGASVSAKDPSTGLVQTVVSNASGEYIFPALQPAAYNVSVTAKGFTTAVYSSVLVNAARTTDLQVKLLLGSQTQTVEVTSHAEVLETSTNTLATTVEGDAIQNLPLSGRDILGFAQLVPGAQSGGQQRYTTFDGLPNAAINITMDGMNDNFQRFRSSSSGFYNPAPARLGAMQEVTVATNDLTADAGAEGSTEIRFISQKGTNTFHGLAFWEPRNSFFNANSYTNNALGVKRAQLHQNDWGGSIGGPFLKNKLFFFLNYEELDVPGSTTMTANVLNTDAQNGIFDYIETGSGAENKVNLLTVAANNGLHGADTSGTICSPGVCGLAAGSGSSGMLATINGYATHGTLTPLTTNLIQNQLSWNQPSTTTNRYPTARLDYQITRKLAWHGSWDTWWRKISGAPPYPTDPHNGTVQSFKSTYYTATSGVDWTINPALLNQANFGVLGTVEEFAGENSPTVFQSQGDRRISTSLLSAIIPNSLPEPRNNPVWQISDNLTYTRGNHTFTFGGDWRYSNSHDTTYSLPPNYSLGLAAGDPASSIIQGALPNVNAANGDLANAFALYALLSGRVSGISGTNNVNSITHQYAVSGPRTNGDAQTIGGVYMQDAWRATPHFALNYGFRWQMSGAIHNTNGIYTSPTLADLLGPSSTLFQPGVITGITNPQIYLRPSPYKGDMIEPAPNVGFAWNPDFESGILGKITGGSNLVVRGGAAISHYDEGWITFESAAFGNPGASQTVSFQAGSNANQFPPGSLSLDSANLPPSNSLVGFPATFTFPLAESLFTFNGNSFSTVDPAIRTPYVENWNLGIQRKIGAGSSFEVSYVGNHTVHMWRIYDLNEINIFENGFLQDFKNAQTDLAINQANGKGKTFSDQTGAPGLVPLPILDSAFGVTGSQTADASPLSASQGFQSSTFITDLQQGQAGAMANTMAGNSTYLCGLVGSTFSPCTAAGLKPGNYPINFFQANPYATGRSISLLSDPGNETYNGLQMQFKHPVTHGLLLMANYTLSHSITDRYNTSDSTSQSYITLRDPSLNKGLSPYDLRHVFRVFGTYDLPFGKGRMHAFSNSILNDVVGGWTVSTIVTLQSGRPFLLTSGFDPFNNHDGGVVLNGISKDQLQSAIGVYPGPSPAEPILFISPGLLSNNKNVSPQFVTPPATPGQLGSFVYLHGPGFFNTDMALLKRIPIRENLHLNIRAEFLNVFNNVEWAVGSSVPADSANTQSSSFPAASLANSPRNIQFRIELAF